MPIPATVAASGLVAFGSVVVFVRRSRFAPSDPPSAASDAAAVHLGVLVSAIPGRRRDSFGSGIFFSRPALLAVPDHRLWRSLPKSL